MVLQAGIDTKQNLLTANWPIRLQNDVLSFGFLSMSDAAAAAAERTAHLNTTNTNSQAIALLTEQVADNTTQIARLEADIASLLASQPNVPKKC